MERGRRGNNTCVTTRRRNKTSQGEVLFFCAPARAPSTFLSTFLIGPERKVGDLGGKWRGVGSLCRMGGRIGGGRIPVWGVGSLSRSRKRPSQSIKMVSKGVGLRVSGGGKRQHSFPRHHPRPFSFPPHPLPSPPLLTPTLSPPLALCPLLFPAVPL